MMIIFMLKILFLKVPPWKRIPELDLTDGFFGVGFFFCVFFSCGRKSQAPFLRHFRVIVRMFVKNPVCIVAE